MKPALDFIHCLGRALDTMEPSAQEQAHLTPALEFAAYDALCQLLKREAEPVFLFMDHDVVLAQQPLARLSERNWTRALTQAGIVRIEVSQGVTREEFACFVQVLRGLLSQEVTGVTELTLSASPQELPHFRFCRIDSGTLRRNSGNGPRSLSSLRREVEATEWLLGQAARGERISHGLAWTVTRSLFAALRDEKSALRLLIPLEEDHRYAAVHAMNASLLAMALADGLGSSESYVKAVGEAAILHDVGQARVPSSIVGKPGKLSPEEWEVVKRHPADGARMLLDSGPGMNLAATVAYEHHIGYDGNGYPAAHYALRLHPATQLLQVCDVYDALRTRRPYRDPWTSRQIKSYLLAESGRSLHPDAVRGLTTMLDRDLGEESGLLPARG